MVPSAFLLSPQTPSQPEPDSGKPRSLREPYAVTPCAQHAHFPKPEFLALHVSVWLSPGSPPVSVAEPSVTLSSFDRMATVTHCPIKHGTRGKAPSVVFNVSEKHHIVLSCLGHRILKDKIRAIPPSNRVTLMMTSTSVSFSWRDLLYTHGNSGRQYEDLQKARSSCPLHTYGGATWSSPTIV